MPLPEVSSSSSALRSLYWGGDVSRNRSPCVRYHEKAYAASCAGFTARRTVHAEVNHDRSDAVLETNRDRDRQDIAARQRHDSAEPAGDSGGGEWSGR